MALKTSIGTPAAPTLATANIIGYEKGVDLISEGTRTVARSFITTTYEWVAVAESTATAFVAAAGVDVDTDSKVASLRLTNRILGAYSVTLTEKNPTGYSGR